MVEVIDYKVEKCLLGGGRDHDLCKFQLIKDVTQDETIKIPTYNHRGLKVPTSLVTHRWYQ